MDATRGEDAVLLTVKVKPSARTPGLRRLPDGTWVAQVQAPPIDGRANDELIRLIADHFGVRRAQVSLRGGATGRMKRVWIEGHG